MIQLFLVLNALKTLVHVVRQASVSVEGDQSFAQLLEGNVDLTKNTDGHSILDVWKCVQA